MVSKSYLQVETCILAVLVFFLLVAAFRIAITNHSEDSEGEGEQEEDTKGGGGGTSRRRRRRTNQ